jgi:putative ABC transport system ATP-binding protein
MMVAAQPGALNSMAIHNRIILFMSAPSLTPILQAVDVARQVVYGGDTLTILRGVNMTVATGETVAIVGSSGSGKSTLLGILAGLDHASNGQVLLFGKSLSHLSEDERAKLRQRLVGFVFQSFQLLPALTALENVMLPLELAGLRGAREQAAAMLARVGLTHRLGHYPRHLSGGEQQRVALARAFVGEPKLLFADEPTGNLDADTGAQVIELLFTLNREQDTTLVLVTHDASLAARCERVLRLEQGKLTEARHAGV